MAYLCSCPPTHTEGKLCFIYFFHFLSFQASTRYRVSIVGALLIILFRILRFQALFSKPSCAHYFSITLLRILSAQHRHKIFCCYFFNEKQKKGSFST